MGFIDADAHGTETGRQTWSYFDPKEREYAPPESGPWYFEGTVHAVEQARDARSGTEAQAQLQPLSPEQKAQQVTQQFNAGFYPPGCRDLSNVPARLAHMDQLGVDVQCVYSTFWLIDPVRNAMREAAMARSYNRWCAEGTKASNGRLRWFIKVPGRTMERAMEEIEFGAKNGAVGVEFTGYKYNIAPGDPYWYPIYQKCQDLGLMIGFHIGASWDDYFPFPKDTHYRTLSRVPGAFASLVAWDVPKKYPNLKFAFTEAGASWLPFMLELLFRGQRDAALRHWGQDWRKMGADYMADEGHNLFAACYMDDDPTFIASIAGSDCLMLGTDYTHFDVGSDPDGLRITAARTDISKDLKLKVLDLNARRCHNIPASFRPAEKAAQLALAAR